MDEAGVRAGDADPGLFGSGGDVAAVMAAFDWSATVLGAPSGWPPLLQALVRMMLTSRFPMWLGWGPELTFFYNDAYRRDTLGVKHPWALGRPAWEVWSEIWQDIGPRIEAVMTSGRATWDESLLLFLERSGYREETYHTFSYSPVSDRRGNILGMLCVVSEDTDRVIGERRMATLRDLASGLSAARTEPETLAAAAGGLATNTEDLPFTLIYTLGEDGRAHLAASTGLVAGDPAAPALLDPADADAAWPVGELSAGRAPVLVSALAERFPALPTGAWDDPPSVAVLVPLSEHGEAELAGFLVAGLNPYRPHAPLLAFVELLAGQISAGMASARAYEAERQRAEALAELDRAKTEFFSNVSHEFRTPLTLILAPAEDALDDDLHPLPDAQRTRIEVIERNARRLRRLVNDMLDFARIEGGRLQAETVQTDLEAYTRDVALSFAPAIERAGLGFDLDIAPLGRLVPIDRDMWEKIVLNLLSNALKFTLEGEIRLELRGHGEEVELVVADTGVGIAPDQLPQLFQRFHRAPRTAARSHEGTGIGLALVAELVKLHGGTVAATSTEGRGSSFSVRIPYGTAAQAQPPQQRESSRQAFLDEALQWNAPSRERSEPAVRRTAVGRTSDATVLVADDNPDMRSYVAGLLEPFWRVETAADGEEALELARAKRPDLVLSDVMMPRLDGFALLAALRAEPATATVPVVFLSARAGEEAAVGGLEAGADDYLVKPFSALELIARVRSNLELSALRNEEADWRRAIFESLTDGVAILDAAGTIVEANAAFEQILGYPRTDVPYKPPFPWLPEPREVPEGLAESASAYESLLRDGRVETTVTVRHRLGHLLVMRVSGRAIGEDETRRYVATFRDVTAELAASEREGALARLGIALADAADVLEVERAGLAEVGRAFGARRVSIVWTTESGASCQASTDGEGPGLSPHAQRVLAPARTGVVTMGSVAGDGGGPLAALAAPLEPGGELVVVLELDPPRRLTPEERALFGVLCGFLGQARRRAQLFDDSRAVAGAMQRSILGPTEVPAGIAVRYLPAVQPLEVGGDWYDIVELSGGRLALVTGDCTGRGLEAATTMGQLRSACRALLLEHEHPGRVVAALDRFALHIPGAICTTVFCAVLDRASGELSYSSAGHLPGFVVAPDGAVSRLSEATAPPLGIVGTRPRPEATVRLPEGSLLLLYTDGLIERRGESLEVGFERLGAALVRLARLAPDELADALVASLVPPGRQEDDIALVLYRHLPAVRPARFSATISCDPAELGPLRQAFRAWCEGAGAEKAVAEELLVALGEACANAIEHAYGLARDGEVLVTASASDEALEIAVEDAGQWKSATPPASDRGRGLRLMRAFSDEVLVERGERGTRVRLRRRMWRGG